MELKSLDKVLQIVADEVAGDIQAYTLRTFLLIGNAGQTGVTQQELEEKLGLSNAATSRNVSYWTYLRADKKAGPDFVSREEDPNDRRIRVLTLTPKGKAFYERLRAVFKAA